MIYTDFDYEIPLIMHRAEGIISLADVQRAMKQTASLHEHHDAAVLWDLRDLPFKQAPQEFELGVPQLINFMQSRCSGRKRAFVVDEKWQQEFLEAVIAASSAPWPWAVFTNFEDGSIWVRAYLKTDDVARLARSI